MNETALITGASGGIGLELAQVIAEKGYNLVLVARSEHKLQEIAADLRQKHRINVTVIAKDLSATEAPDRLFDETEAQGIQIDVLVNNAGFATYGLFHELEMQRELQMAQLNMIALTHLTRLYLPGMVQRGFGRILNIASTAAFQPGPLMAVYYASKAYVLSFSEAIANELKGTGVAVTALCPGPTQSGFQARAQMEESKLVQSGLMEARAVAEAGIEGMVAGKTMVVPGATNWLGTLLPRFLPRRMTTQIVRNMQERTGAH